MISLKKLTLGLALAATSASPLHALPLESPSTDLAIRTPETKANNALSTRDPGTVALYTRNDEGVRVNKQAVRAGVALAAIGTSGCVLITAVTGGATAPACIAIGGVLGSVALGAVTAMKGTADLSAVKASNLAQSKVPPGGKLLRRVSAVEDPDDENDLSHPDNLIHYYPATDDVTSVELMQRAYNGTDLLVAHSHCEGFGCHEFYYSNEYADHTGIDTIHRVKRAPRQSSGLGKRVNNGGIVPGSNLPPGYMGVESGQINGKDIIYSSYSFWNIAPAKYGITQESTKMPSAVDEAFGHLDALGLYCANVHDIGVGGKDTQATAGVISFQLDDAYQWGEPVPTDRDGGSVAVPWGERDVITMCQKEGEGISLP